MVLKEKDQKNLDELVAFLEVNGMRAELRGSAAIAKAVPEGSKRREEYQDIDLNVWDAKEKGPGYFKGRGAIDEFLGNLGIKDFEHSQLPMATWCEGRWQFVWHGTKFDIVYTPRGNRLALYR